MGGEPPNGPIGRTVPLATGASTWAWEMSGPPGAPALVLLHGWMATAALNWYGSLEYLGRSFRVVAPDLRGHGRLGQGAPPFSVEACADDIASLEDDLGVGRAVIVGYSMGGAVAQVFAQRHRTRADGIVLCATAASFARRVKLRPALRVTGRVGAAAVRKWPERRATLPGLAHRPPRPYRRAAQGPGRERRQRARPGGDGPRTRAPPRCPTRPIRTGR